MEKNSKIESILLSILLTAIILFFLYKTVGAFSLDYIQSYFTFSIISISMILYLLIKIVNTFRYNLIFNQKDFFKSINILFFSNFMLTILPSRLGEVSYLQLFNKHYGISYSRGLKKIIFLRICDYFAICILMFLSFIFTIESNSEIFKNNYIVFTIGIFALICGVLLLFFFMEFKNSSNSKIINQFFGYLSDIKETKDKFQLILWSLSYWFLRFSLGIYLFWAVGLNLPFVSLFFISTLMMLVSLIPIQTIAGFGIFEGTWTTAFLIFGVNNTNLLNLVLAVHLLGLINVILFGSISFIILYILIRNKSDHIC